MSQDRLSPLKGASKSVIVVLLVVFLSCGCSERTSNATEGGSTTVATLLDSNGTNQTRINPSKVDAVESGPEKGALENEPKEEAKGSHEEDTGSSGQAQEPPEGKSTTTAVDSSTETLRPSEQQNQTSSSSSSSGLPSDYHATKSTLTVTATRIGMTRYFHPDIAQESHQHGDDVHRNETIDDENVVHDANYDHHNRNTNYSEQFPQNGHHHSVALISSIPLVTLASSETLSFPNQRHHESEHGSTEMHDEDEIGFGFGGQDFYDYEHGGPQVTFPFHPPPYFNEYGAHHPMDGEYGLYNQEFENGQSVSNESNTTENIHSLKNLENEVEGHQLEIEPIPSTPVHINVQDLLYLANETKRVIDYYSNSDNNVLYNPSLVAESNTVPQFVEYEQEFTEPITEENLENEIAETLPKPVALVSSAFHENIDNDNLTAAQSDSFLTDAPLEEEFAEAFRRKRPGHRRIRVGNGEGGGLKKRGDKRVRMRVRKLNRSNFTNSFDETVYPTSPSGPSGPEYGDRIENEPEEEVPVTKPPRMKRVRSTTTTTTPSPFPPPFFQNTFNKLEHHSTKLEAVPITKGGGKPLELLLPKPTSTSMRKVPITRNDILSSLPTLSSPTMSTDFAETTNPMYIQEQIENPAKSSYTEKSNYIPITTSQPAVSTSTTATKKPLNGTRPRGPEGSKEWLHTSQSADVHHVSHPDDDTGQEIAGDIVKTKPSHDRKSWENNYMNLQQNSFYASSTEEMDTTGASGPGGSLVDINNHGPSPQSNPNLKTTEPDDIEYEDDSENEHRRMQEHLNHQSMRTKVFSYVPSMEDYAKLAQGLAANENLFSTLNSSSTNPGSSPVSSAKVSVHPHLTVLTPNHPQAKEYFEKLRPSFKDHRPQQVETPPPPRDQTSASSHFDRTKFKFSDMQQSSELPAQPLPFEVGRVVDDEQILKYHTESENNLIQAHHEALEPIVVHHHHHQIVHPVSPSSAPVTPSYSSQELQTTPTVVVDSSAQFQENILSMFDQNNFGSMIGEMANNPHNPFAGSNFNVLQTHTSVPAYTKNSLQQFHPFPNSNAGAGAGAGTVASLPPAQNVQMGNAFQSMPPFKQFPASKPVSAPQQLGTTPSNVPTSYYYSAGNLMPSDQSKQMGQHIRNSNGNSNGKRGPVAVISAGGTDDYENQNLNGASSITLPMPGLVNVPLPPSDIQGMQEVTPHRHYPPHSHSMATHPDYEPANPPLPIGHQLQFHFDPFLQNAGQFPNSDNQDNRLSSRPPVSNHLDKFHDFSQIAQGAQGGQYSGGRDRPQPEVSYPSTRFQGSSHYNNRGRERERERPSSNFNENEGIEEDEEPRQFDRPTPTRFQQNQNDIHQYDEENPDFKNPFDRRPPRGKDTDQEDPYESYDKNPEPEQQESPRGNGEDTKGESSSGSSSPFSDKPYVLMFPSLVPEEAMMPVKPKVSGREIPVISAAELHPSAVPLNIPFESLGPGMEVVHVHPREQMMNVLASKQHEVMMSQYLENKKKPPTNIYTPYGVLVPMGEIGSSPSSSFRANKFLRQPVAPDSHKSSSSSKMKYGEYKGNDEPESEDDETQGTMQPAIDLLADKLAVKLSALGYILKHPPQHMGHDSKHELTQQTSASFNSPSTASLLNKVPDSISSKGIPKVEFRKYVKELLKEKLQEMLREIEESELKEKQYGTKATPTKSPTRRTNVFPMLLAQYSNNVPVAVVLPPKASQQRNKKETPKSVAGGILQSIKNFFSFGTSSPGQNKDGFNQNKTKAQKSSRQSWFYNSRKDFKPLPFPKQSSFPKGNPIGSKTLLKKSTEENQKQRNSFKEVQQLVHILLRAGVKEDEDGDEIMSMQAVLNGLENKNNNLAKIDRRRSEEINYESNLSSMLKLNQPVINDLMTSDSNIQPRRSTSKGTNNMFGEIRVVKPYKKGESLRKIQRRMTKTIVIPSKWKPIPK